MFQKITRIVKNNYSSKNSEWRKMALPFSISTIDRNNFETQR